MLAAVVGRPTAETEFWRAFLNFTHKLHAHPLRLARLHRRWEVVLPYRHRDFH